MLGNAAPVGTLFTGIEGPFKYPLYFFKIKVFNYFILLLFLKTKRQKNHLFFIDLPSLMMSL